MAGIFISPTLQTIIRYINKVPFVIAAIKTDVGSDFIADGSQKVGLNDNAKGYKIIVVEKYSRIYGKPIISGWFQ